MQVLELVQLDAPLFYTCFQPDHPNYCFVSAVTGNEDMNSDQNGATEGQYLHWTEVSVPMVPQAIPAVPEPSTWAFILFGLAVLIHKQVRKPCRH